MIARSVQNADSTLVDGQFVPQEFLDTEIIADPLNRLTPLSVFEKRIICCPEFQRLRRIKQLGFAYFAYPAAEYSRFVHSLGACHQAKNIIDTINENFRNQLRYRQWRLLGRTEGATASPSFNDVAISAFERIVISAAALLHDLPHGPFSHEIESILDRNENPVIPDHDNPSENPALFLYLFDQTVSDLAVLLAQCNESFAPALLQASLAGASTHELTDWRCGIKALKDRGVLTDRGTVTLGAKSPLQPMINGTKRMRFDELPLLPVLIFEILLFEKQEQWLSAVERKSLLGTTGIDGKFGVEVSTNWGCDEKLVWQPLPGWFRAYRRDIIGNTICADLMDYVSRDGYHTGIVSTMDLKFLDRMLIARAVLPPIGEDGEPDQKPPQNRTQYPEIPVACEHVVFDIYDHKRGFIRQSVLTEILAYLQGRYLLCERVYVHRVVEGARTMLQRAVAILSEIEKSDVARRKLLELRDLHPLNDRTAGPAIAPTGDEALLTWIRAIPILEPATYAKHRSKIDDAIDLATMLIERRVFREAIIYDGIHGYQHAGQLAGAEETCRSLEAAFLSGSNRDELNSVLADIDRVLANALASQSWHPDSTGQLRVNGSVNSIVSARKWGKRYKPPLVLVARPLKEKAAIHSGLDIEPLLDCQDPPNIRKQLEAMKDSYDGLWKIYLFVHPVFHHRAFTEAHNQIERILNQFASTHTGSSWRNAIDFQQLLGDPIDNPSLLAQHKERRRTESEITETEAATDTLDPSRVWTAEDVLSILRPLTAKDADNLEKIRVYCTTFAERVQRMSFAERANAATALRKLKTYQPKQPFVLNRLGKYDANAVIARLEKLLGPRPKDNGSEADE